VVTLYCPDCPDLKLGPGVPPDPNVVVFVGGYATLDESDPLFDLKMAWTHSFGAPPIRVLDEDEAPANDPNAVPCPACGMTFASERKLNGHILGAHRKKE
jgi:hypothetical protein